jgi:L-ascorbate metabolism protein UlaG (beta-lactamase superfamily)
MPFEYSGIKISWLGHDGFKIKDDVTIYIDPYEIKPGEKGDIILITHEHFDHCSQRDLAFVSHDKTVIIAPHICKGSIGGFRYGEVVFVSPGDEVERLGIRVKAVPAYNVNKFRSPGVVFHPKEDGRVGYIVELKGVKVYHAGDTDFIDEMRGLGPDIALLPVSGTYVMTYEEAVEAVKAINPKLAIPMHYGAIVASRLEAEEFKRRSPVPVEILEKEDP